MNLPFAILAQSPAAAPESAAAATKPAELPPPPPSTAEAATKAAGLSPEQIQALFETYGLPAIKAIILLFVGWIIARWVGASVRKVCERAHFDITLGRFLSSVVRWLIIAAVVIMCLSSFGVQVTSLVALLGTVGVAIGLAMQGSLSHIASGVMLLIFRPFKVGDAVTAGGQTGVVEEIGLFSTLLNTPDNRRIIVPNSGILNGVITNSTQFETRVADVSVQADAGGPLEPQREVLRNAATTVAGRLPEKPPAVTLTGIGAANVWTVAVWCKTSEFDAVRERLLIACNAAISGAKCAPPPPVTLVKNV